MTDSRGLVIFEAFPVQYHAPVYAQVARRARELGCNEPVRVAYSTIATATGFKDQGFGRTIGWGGSVLEGYDYDVLDAHDGGPISGGFWSHRSRGVGAYLERHRPRAVLLSSVYTAFDVAALLHARRLGAEVWLRQETQDEALPRSAAKAAVRGLVYRALYGLVDRFFAIGELNRAHYLRHGVAADRIGRAPYCTVDRIGSDAAVSPAACAEARAALRLDADDFVLLFSGKLIPKKNPDIVVRAIARLPEALQRRLTVVYCGDGEMLDELKTLAAGIGSPARYRFEGFVGQADLSRYYLAADCLVLPSRRMGETWGLVVNEAMQAGAKVIVSDAVGSSADLRGAPGVEPFASEDAGGLADALERHLASPVTRVDVRRAIAPYSVDVAAEAIARRFVAKAGIKLPA
jgi:glycosyltransferase involved in cell wall biosynthesis